MHFQVAPAWSQWQEEILALLSCDFGPSLGRISMDDEEWPAWRPFFDQGRSPRSAIERALERDL